MPKSRARKPRRRNQSPPKPTRLPTRHPPQSPWRDTGSHVARMGRKFWATVGVVATVAGLLVLRPKLTATADEALESSRPFSFPIVLQNDSELSISDVEPLCEFTNIVYSGLRVLQSSMVAKGTPRLQQGERMTTHCNYTPQNMAGTIAFDTYGALKSGDLSIYVSFRYSFLGLPMARRFRFVAAVTPGGVRWLPQPVEAH
jgi:hypothetical protein